MRWTSNALLWASFATSIAVADPAWAQHPLCPAPAPDDSYYVTCRLGGDRVVTSFLYDFSVRHLFTSPDAFEIPTATIFGFLDDPMAVQADPDARAAFLKNRPTVVFRPIDATTGEFKSEGANGEQTLTVSHPALGSTVVVTVPAVVQGLYWRSPGHLDLQFYRERGVRFRITAPGAPDFDEALQCVSITPFRARATTADPKHRHLIDLFEGCE
jgi:hypothetical protein